MRKYSIIFYTLLFVLVTSCGSKVPDPVEVKVDSVTEHPNDNIATLTPEQIKTIGIELGSIETKGLTNTIKVNGQLTVPNKNKAYVTPVFSGVVKTLRVQPGDFVSRGQVIATIENPDLIQMQQQLQQVNGPIQLADLEVNRQKQLVAGNAAPLKRLQQAETDLATLRSQRSGLQKKLGSIGASQSYSSLLAVKAPISGAISKVSAQIGSNVEMSAPIAEIVNNSLLHLDIYVYEKDLPKVKLGQTIHFTLTNNPGINYDARIFSVGSAFDSESKTVPVHAEVTGNKTGLIDGMNVTALISLDRAPVAAVPSEAIVPNKGQDYIFIVTDKHSEPEHLGDGFDSSSAKDVHEHTEKQKAKIEDKNEVNFERIPVAKGVTELGYTQITPLKPIPPNAKVVVKNAFFVMTKLTFTGEADH